MASGPVVHDYNEKDTPPYGYNGSNGSDHHEKKGADEGVKVTTLDTGL
jgi:hypothetical protein